MQDTILLIRELRADGTTVLRRTRIPADGPLELRLRFMDGRFSKAYLLRGLRVAAESSSESPKGNAERTARAAHSVDVDPNPQPEERSDVR